MVLQTGGFKAARSEMLEASGSGAGKKMEQARWRVEMRIHQGTKGGRMVNTAGTAP